MDRSSRVEMVAKLNKKKALYDAEYAHCLLFLRIVICSEQILECIKEIDKIKDNINIEVPMEAIEYGFIKYIVCLYIKAHIDIHKCWLFVRCLCDGGNPDSFMNEYIREVYTEDQQAHSKTEAIHVSKG